MGNCINKEQSSSNQIQSHNSKEEPPDKTSLVSVIKVPLLPPAQQEYIGRKLLILDLDETLLHSSFKPIPKSDFIIPIEIDGVTHKVYTNKRPHVDEFLLRVSKHYELCVWSASLPQYGDPVMDKLDINNVISHRLWRKSCAIYNNEYTKELDKVGRQLKDIIIIDNSPGGYLFHPTNAIPISSWFDDPKDKELFKLLPVLETTLKDINDVRNILDASNKSFQWICQQADKSAIKSNASTDSGLPTYSQSIAMGIENTNNKKVNSIQYSLELNDNKQEIEQKLENTNDLLPTDLVEKQFYKFLKQMRMEKYFDKFKEMECCDMDSIEYFDDDTINNEIGIKSVIARKKFLGRCDLIKEEMTRFKHDYSISSVLTKQLAEYGIVTMDILCTEVQTKQMLEEVYKINDNEACDMLWDLIKKNKVYAPPSYNEAI